MISETREFRLHKDILWSIIKSQAGTLSKAILELVMNSVDAGASRIDITLSPRAVTVSDDGKGFIDRESVEAFFEVFGTPHDKGDARYGRFRMGRGQIMAFTRNVWHSGQFVMAVDIRDKGLAYDLTMATKETPGCRIVGELYEERSPSELIRTQDQLREMCRYVPIPVFLNKARISVDLADESWTFQDDDAYYRLRPTARDLQVFNLGVLVRSYFGEYGVGGIVVSKVPLELNTARNDILLSECAAWKRIATKLRAYSRTLEERSPAQNENYRTMMMDRLLSGGFDTLDEMTEAMERAKTFTDCTGKHYSLYGLHTAAVRSRLPIVAPSEPSPKADRTHQARLAIVLSPKTLERAGNRTVNEILDRIQTNLQLFGGKDWKISSTRQIVNDLIKRIGDFDEISAGINDQRTILNDKDLTRDERLTINVVRAAAAWVQRAAEAENERLIRACESESVHGFTDGKTYICINRSFLRIGGYAREQFSRFHAIGSLLLHEYLHDADDATGHGHPAEFYEAFHTKASTDSNFQNFVYEALRAYHKARRKAGLPLRLCDQACIDMLATACDEAQTSADAPQPHSEQPEAA